MNVLKTDYLNAEEIIVHHRTIARKLHEYGYVSKSEEWYSSPMRTKNAKELDLVIGEEQVAEIAEFRSLKNTEQITFFTKDAGEGVKFYTIDIQICTEYNVYETLFEAYLLVEDDADLVALRLQGII